MDAPRIVRLPEGGQVGTQHCEIVLQLLSTVSTGQAHVAQQEKETKCGTRVLSRQEYRSIRGMGTILDAQEPVVMGSAVKRYYKNETYLSNCTIHPLWLITNFI